MGTGARIPIALAVTLAVAASCWAVVISQMSSMALIEMAPVMMAAMMLPSASPLVAGQAGRPADALWAIAVYLVIWAVIGIAAYAVAAMLPMASLPIAIAAVTAAVLYGLTPLQRACRARCAALCGAGKPGLRLGLEYAVNCVGCSAGVMFALLVVGPMNPLWMLLATAVVCFYKLPVSRLALRL